MSDMLPLVVANATAAAVLALVAWLASRHVRHQAVVHGLWVVALLKLVTPPILSLPLVPAWTLPASLVAPSGPAVVILGPATGGEAGPVAPTTFAGAETGATTPIAPSPAREASSRLAPAREATIAPGPTSEARMRPPLGTVDGAFLTHALSLVVLGGALAVALLALARVRRFGALLRHATPAPSAVSARAAELGARMGLRRAPPVSLLPARVPPMLWLSGAGPVILMPKDLLPRLDAEECEALLAHELAHVRRGDHWVRLLELATSVLFWWYPVAWWARRALRRAEERCCDEWVLRLLPASAAAYAEGLLKSLAFVSREPEALPAAASGIAPVRDLEARLKEIMMARPRPRLAGPARVALAAAAVLGLAVFPTQARPNGDQVSPPDWPADQPAAGGTNVEVAPEVAVSADSDVHPDVDVKADVDVTPTVDVSPDAYVPTDVDVHPAVPVAPSVDLALPVGDAPPPLVAMPSVVAPPAVAPAPSVPSGAPIAAVPPPSRPLPAAAPRAALSPGPGPAPAPRPVLAPMSTPAPAAAPSTRTQPAPPRPGDDRAEEAHRLELERTELRLKELEKARRWFDDDSSREIERLAALVARLQSEGRDRDAEAAQARLRSVRIEREARGRQLELEQERVRGEQDRARAMRDAQRNIERLHADGREAEAERARAELARAERERAQQRLAIERQQTALRREMVEAQRRAERVEVARQLETAQGAERQRLEAIQEQLVRVREREDRERTRLKRAFELQEAAQALHQRELEAAELEQAGRKAEAERVRAEVEEQRAKLESSERNLRTEHALAAANDIESQLAAQIAALRQLRSEGGARSKEVARELERLEAALSALRAED